MRTENVVNGAFSKGTPVLLGSDGVMCCRTGTSKDWTGSMWKNGHGLASAHTSRARGKAIFLEEYSK